MNFFIKPLLILSAISFNSLAIASTLNVDNKHQVITLKVVGCELNKNKSYNQHPGKISYHKVIDKKHAAKICDGTFSSLTSIELSVNNNAREPSVVGVWQARDYVGAVSLRWVNGEWVEFDKKHDEYQVGFSLGLYVDEENDGISIGYELAEIYGTNERDANSHEKNKLSSVEFPVIYSIVNKNRAEFNRGKCLLVWGGVNPVSESRRFVSICESSN
ncbi:hypothetical protein LES60_18250 [Pectobacterium brasiliense]|uniref:Uncharacterized protein n=3 Tax=Pectobacterium TaxID=122277 RepID=A0ABS0S245_PECPM|nr:MULTISPECIES: hypothetical protein [Pectobacterium]GKW32100.1 hypothetical protein PEC730217_08800 [Pectobacterium carotovorum subsp. carotovorum]ACX86525.1 hypothetical protein Pecwa_0704 [Pectobacterium parmentieri WPP163]MBI0555935.1 hypothetical protein [Pectobacterium parmentieri]MBS4430927.1 hypothetical protein [Pectobacterium punjabense]MBT9184296.1 hypothetical protein [Pectobacterium punjabense]